ncbi:MAG: S1C family serine protease, partial [Planktothrix sp.]
FFYGNSGKQQYIQEGSGSGVILSDDGYVVTNNHVINGADEINVILNDKRSYRAEVIGTDASTDIALLKIKEKDLPFISYGNSETIKVGEWVLAVGNPFNLNSTVTAGIISAKGRGNIIDGN